MAASSTTRDAGTVRYTASPTFPADYRAGPHDRASYPRWTPSHRAATEYSLWSAHPEGECCRWPKR